MAAAVLAGSSSSATAQSGTDKTHPRQSKDLKCSIKHDCASVNGNGLAGSTSASAIFQPTMHASRFASRWKHAASSYM
eukprot:1008987-Pyramimonas_sp.AAC.1